MNLTEIWLHSDESSEEEMIYSAADTFLTCVEFSSHSRRVLNRILSEARLRYTYALLAGIYRSLAYVSLLAVSLSRLTQL